jgi:hypothetical protein
MAWGDAAKTSVRARWRLGPRSACTDEPSQELSGVPLQRRAGEPRRRAGACASACSSTAVFPWRLRPRAPQTPGSGRRGCVWLAAVWAPSGATRDVGPHPQLLSNCRPVRTGTPSGSSAIPRFHRWDAYGESRLDPAAMGLRVEERDAGVTKACSVSTRTAGAPRKQIESSLVVKRFFGRSLAFLTSSVADSSWWS